MTDKLLTVLDISEDEKWDFLHSIDLVCSREILDKQHRREKLADLAERLWEETMHSPNMHKAMLDVHQAVEGPQNKKIDYVFWAMRAKSIHKILVALKAKEKMNV